MQLRYSLITGILLMTLSLKSQNGIDSLLAGIQSNNKSILVAQKKMISDKALYQTGLSLSNPEFTFDWLKGFPETAGSQTEFIVAQPFDFPSVYKFRKEISSLKTTQTTYAYDQVRKAILLEAKLTAYELVYLNKRKALLAERLINAERFYENYQLKLKQQDATILELNKAGLFLFNVRTDIQLVETEISKKTQKLIELNGGVEVTVADTSYPAEELLLGFESLEQLIEETDPQLKYFEMQAEIGETEQKLTRASLLPSFEAGYRYQGILGQTFHGVHTGISVPLWGSGPKKNYPVQLTTLYTAMIDEHKVEHYNTIKQLYDQYEMLRQNLETFSSGFAQITNTEILEKALASGQITVLEYYLESTIYYESMDRYLELENAKHKVLAELLQFSL
jgi:hypothetical protein